ncbi:MAG TPA: formate/nitrite transporter family protein, partial [Pseudorhizobium sp.]|nr:formate/nitrite transporter family protein [Pseudorhizobium sp.]
LLWNEIPTVVGNLVGGLTFVGGMIYATHYKTSPSRKPAEQPAARLVAAE